MTFENADIPRADEWLTQGDPAEGCEISVYGVPTSAGSGDDSGTHAAPAAVREVLSRYSTFESGEGIDLLKVTAIDGGDWELDGLDLETTHGRIREFVTDSSLGNTAAVFWGGDKSITRPLMEGTSPEWNRVFGLLTFDARHRAGALDHGPMSGTAVRGLIEGGLSGERISQIGIQPFADSREHRDYADHTGVSVRTMRDVHKSGIEEVVLKELHHISGRADWIYVSFSTDVLDVAFAPGSAGARPGGLTPRELTQAAYLAGRNPKVIVADFVDADPDLDPSGITTLAVTSAFLSFCAGVTSRPLRT